MGFVERLKEQLDYYHNATDIPLELRNSDGELIAAYYPEKNRYCELIHEACGERSFCDRVHRDKAGISEKLKEGYIFMCPAGLTNFIIPALSEGRADYYVQAGPFNILDPDISLIDEFIKIFALDEGWRDEFFAEYSSMQMVEPVRLQNLCKMLFAIVNNLPRVSVEGDIVETEEDGQISSAVPAVQNAILYIKEHYSENLKLEQVAAYVGLNPSYFSSVFKSELNISFSHYLMQKRIEAACILLLRSNSPLSDIAASVGIENQSYFSHVFREHMGMSPKEYRKQR